MHCGFQIALCAVGGPTCGVRRNANFYVGATVSIEWGLGKGKTSTSRILRWAQILEEQPTTFPLPASAQRQDPRFPQFFTREPLTRHFQALGVFARVHLRRRILGDLCHLLFAICNVRDGRLQHARAPRVGPATKTQVLQGCMRFTLETGPAVKPCQYPALS